MKLSFAEKIENTESKNWVAEILSFSFFICLFVSTAALAETESFPSTDPVPPIPVGAHLEQGDMLVWDDDGTEAAPTGNFWSGGTVPYLFSSNVSLADQALMEAAMRQWESIANVTFRDYQTGDLLGSWLFIQDSTHNSSFIGPSGPAQVVNIFNWNVQMIMVHELGHALGIEHEQARTDRNTYVTVIESNIVSECGDDGASSCLHNFAIDSDTGFWLYSPYDYDSVMHYSSTAFNIGSSNTIITDWPYDTQNISYTDQDIGLNGQCFTNDVPAGTWQAGIGQRDHMSHWDCRMMSFVYPQSNWRFVLPSRSPGGFFEVGSFFLPWDSFSDALATPANGTVWIDGGHYDAPTNINQSVTILAPKGSVFLD